jgi:Sulfite exporter TauE/SafE
MMSALGLEAFTSASMLFLVGSAFVAGLARGFSGFGSALIFIPLASSLIGAMLASPLLLVIDFVAAAPLIPNAWRHAERRDVGTMLLGTLIGVPVGTWALTRMDPLAVRWMIVALIVPMLALLISGWRYRGNPTTALTAAVGAVAGFFNGVAQVGGPPIVLYWLRDLTAARTIRQHHRVFCRLQRAYHDCLFDRRRADDGRGRTCPAHRPCFRGRTMARFAYVRARQRGNVSPHLLRADRARRADQPAAVRRLAAIIRSQYA